MIEVCTGSVESVLAACRGGAHRVELCSALSEDGLTPSAGMIKSALQCGGLRIHVLIRPRGGDFVYSAAEVECMKYDILCARRMGAHGVVFGALTADGDIDVPACSLLAKAAEGMDMTFHRAFDVCRCPEKALEQIVQLGFSRLLTSGQAPTAEEGIPLLRKLVQQASGRIIVMPGGGVNPDNALHILSETGATDIHGSFRSQRVFPWLETDELTVRKVVEAIECKAL